ncbi:hypothetical protein V2J09_014299 [Rumex salicifolius]
MASVMDGHDDETKQSTADMTVQGLLQQMQNRFQTMSDSITTKNILSIALECLSEWSEFLFSLTETLSTIICSGFLDCIILDEMGGRIAELEQSIGELRSEMGAEGSPSPSAAAKPISEETKDDTTSA